MVEGSVQSAHATDANMLLGGLQGQTQVSFLWLPYSHVGGLDDQRYLQVLHNLSYFIQINTQLLQSHKKNKVVINT